MAFHDNQKPSKFKDAQLSRPRKGLLNFLRWKAFTEDENELLILTDETGETTGYLDMLTVLGKDLDFVYGQGTDGASRIINGYNNLLRTYLEDFDILIVQMPADSHVQQSNWSLALAQVNEALKATPQDQKRYKQLLQRRALIRQQIGLTTFVSKNVDHEAYTVFIYGNTERETVRLREQFKHSGGNAIETQPMTLEQKKFVLQVLSDPTRQLTGD